MHLQKYHSDRGILRYRRFVRVVIKRRVVVIGIYYLSEHNNTEYWNIYIIKHRESFIIMNSSTVINTFGTFTETAVTFM